MCGFLVVGRVLQNARSHKLIKARGPPSLCRQQHNPRLRPLQSSCKLSLGWLRRRLWHGPGRYKHNTSPAMAAGGNPVGFGRGHLYIW